MKNGRCVRILSLCFLLVQSTVFFRPASCRSDEIQCRLHLAASTIFDFACAEAEFSRGTQSLEQLEIVFGGHGCSRLEWPDGVGAVEHKGSWIAVVDRGLCSFFSKSSVADSLGAAALVVIETSPLPQPSVMGSAPGEVLSSNLLVVMAKSSLRSKISRGEIGASISIHLPTSSLLRGLAGPDLVKKWANDFSIEDAQLLGMTHCLSADELFWEGCPKQALSMHSNVSIAKHVTLMSYKISLSSILARDCPHDSCIQVRNILLNNAAVIVSAQGNIELAKQLLALAALAVLDSLHHQQGDQDLLHYLAIDCDKVQSKFIGRAIESIFIFNYLLLSWHPEKRTELYPVRVFNAAQSRQIPMDQEALLDVSNRLDLALGASSDEAFHLHSEDITLSRTEIAQWLKGQLFMAASALSGFQMCFVEDQAELAATYLRSFARSLHFHLQSASWHYIEVLQWTLAHKLNLSASSTLCGEYLPGTVGPYAFEMARAHHDACLARTTAWLSEFKSRDLRKVIGRTIEGPTAPLASRPSIGILSPSFSRMHPAGQQISLLLEAFQDHTAKDMPAVHCLFITESTSLPEEHDDFYYFAGLCGGTLHVLRPLSELRVSAIELESISKLFEQFNIKTVIDISGYTTNGAAFRLLSALKAVFEQSLTVMHLSDRINPYAGGWGLGAYGIVDFIIGDRMTTPGDLQIRRQDSSREGIILLPSEFWVGKPAACDVDTSSRSSQGVSINRVVFAHVGRVEKIDVETFRVWCNTLAQIATSELWIFEPQSITRNLTNITEDDGNSGLMSKLIAEASTFSASMNLKQEAKALGIHPSRLRFMGRVDHEEHLDRLSKDVTVALDSRYYNGLTTTADILRSGVPLVTLQGVGSDLKSASSYHSRAASAMDFTPPVAAATRKYEALSMAVTTTVKEMESTLQQVARLANLYKTMKRFIDCWKTTGDISTNKNYSSSSSSSSSTNKDIRCSTSAMTAAVSLQRAAEISQELAYSYPSSQFSLFNIIVVVQ